MQQALMKHPPMSKPLVTPPLVSIVIYNRNHGKYLAECFDSVLNQSHPNIEILFADNASTDDSWKIACDYTHQYPEQFFILRNNKHSDLASSLKSCLSNLRGKYFLILGADGRLDADCIEKAVKPLEAHPDACMALMHRHLIAEDHSVHSEAPFYSASCKILPPQLTTMYLLAEVNPSISQILYRTTHYIGAAAMEGADGHGTRKLGHRILDFTLSCSYAVIYLNEPLVYQRMHAQADHTGFASGLGQLIASYFLTLEFCDIAQQFGHTQVSQGWNASVARIAALSLKYAAEHFVQDHMSLAKRFYYFAAALDPAIEQHPVFQKLAQYWRDPQHKAALIQDLNAYCLSQHRTVSHEPPTGSQLLPMH